MIPETEVESQRRVLVVGSGTRFVSGVSHYTWKVAGALSSTCQVSVILINHLIPKVFYPGKRRVGRELSSLAYDHNVAVLDGVDWWLIPSIFRAVRFIRNRRPETALFQWWTGAVGIPYLVMALAARSVGSTVIVEFHEVQDVGEARVPFVRLYARLMMRSLLRLSAGVVFHSQYDLNLVANHYDLRDLPSAIIPHGPYDQYRASQSIRARRYCPDSALNVLFFGIIRPFKGLEYLVEAFAGMSEQEVDRMWLTIVGETWEGWTLPEELIRDHRYRDRITFVNEYVSDEELTGWLAGADLVVLPYLRSSSSGPLQAAMSVGLPVIVTNVGGLPEAAENYLGATFIEPMDAAAIRLAILRCCSDKDRENLPRYEDPHSWRRSADLYTRFFESVGDVYANDPRVTATGAPISAPDPSCVTTSARKRHRRSSVLPVSVIIPCFASNRWNLLSLAIESIESQQPRPAEIIVAVDHNPSLFRRVASAFPTTRVIENTGEHGLSANRNSGVAHADNEFIAFLDDDARALPGWLGALFEPLSDGQIIGTGGIALPVWLCPRPRWFPDEFGWIIGANIGPVLPQTGRVRNVWGQSMALRTADFREIGGFRADFGKIGARYRCPEDTDLCVRLSRHRPHSSWLMVADAKIEHVVSRERATLSFFLQRCYWEGRQKAEWASGGGRLTVESDFVTRRVPNGLKTYLLRAALDGDLDNLARATSLVLGASSAALGAAAWLASEVVTRDPRVQAD
jgi:glycosyltransferase involved in cell wall biosynthesis